MVSSSAANHNPGEVALADDHLPVLPHLPHSLLGLSPARRIEMVRIDKDTTMQGFKKELQLNEIYYMLNKALV